MRKPTHLALKLAIFALIAFAAGASVLLQYHCPIRSLTGVICPGCGMSRAWLNALRLDFSRAMYYHPMFWAVPLFMLFALYDLNLFSKRLYNILALSLLGAVFTVSYILRLLAFLRGNYAI